MRNKNTHILVVENDPQEVASILRALTANGIENPVAVANCGHTALSMLKGLGRPALLPTPRIILLNIDLPEKDGLRFLHEIRRDDQLKACNVYVMSDHRTEELLLQAYDLNVAGYILKPLHPQSCNAIIKTLQSYWDLIELPN